MKLWDKGSAPAAEIERFTVGQDRELDLRLAPWDIAGTLAHITMLTSVGLLTPEELDQLTPALRRLYQQVEAGDFQIEPGVEDVHSQVELMLTRELGDVGKKIHSGRSRNDQVLVDLKLLFKHEIEQLVAGVAALFETLQSLSEQHREVLIPGYTHLQVAMPSSFGLWFGAFAENLSEDLLLLHAAWENADRNPLGSAAGYGSSFPLDRQLTTRLLGFGTLHHNVVNAQMSRGRCEKVIGFALAGLGGTLNKLATDVCLYMSQNFGFISFPDELTTGSSIMPHKKNPDVFELVRGHTARLQALPGELSFLSNNLPSGYHRDMQLLKEVLLPALDRARDCLAISTYMLREIQVRRDIVQAPMYDYLFSVEAVNELVLSGVPFRDAYRQVGHAIEEGSFAPVRRVQHTHLGSIGALATAEIRASFEAVQARFDFAGFHAALGDLLDPDTTR
jgi:argininosuccinate lyase